MTEKNPESKIFNSFKKALNNHGYGFQYKVLKEASDLSEESGFPWMFVVGEFPVNVTNYDTRIDFILKNIKYPLYLICECKRANPAIQNWCFVRAPYVHEYQKKFNPITLERIRHDCANPYRAEAYILEKQNSDAYHISIEIRSGEKGESHTKGRGSIEEAVTQVMKGLNGYANYISKQKNIIPEKKWIDMLPVIFTTAKLWVSNINLSNSDINSGQIDFKESSFEEKNWLWYQYHLSPSLKHGLPIHDPPVDIIETLDKLYGRSIAIVNPNGIKEFLTKLHESSIFIKGTYNQSNV